MKTKTALRILGRFGVVSEHASGWGTKTYRLAGPVMALAFTDSPSGQASNFRTYHNDGMFKFLLAKNLHAAVRTVFEQSRRLDFKYAGHALWCNARLLYQARGLYETARLEVGLMHLDEGITTRYLAGHTLDTRHPQAVAMLRDVLAGEDPGILLDWMQEHQAETTRGLADFVRDVT
jgi:hypothetical protein